jgi:hypothetical protein
MKVKLSGEVEYNWVQKGHLNCNWKLLTMVVLFSGNSYLKVEDNSAERKKYHHFGDMLFNLTGLEHMNSYVTAPGACRGDSGGPAYTNEGGKFIVTGTFFACLFYFTLSTLFLIIV